MRFVLIAAALLLAGCSTPAPEAGTPTATTTTTQPPTSAEPSPVPPTCEKPTPTATCGGSGPSGDAPTNQTPPPERSRFAGCVGSGPVTFARSPMRDEDVRYLLPYGLLAGGHVTPIDHMYFEPKDRALGRDVYEVRAIADGVIYTLQPRDAVNEMGVPKGREWHVRFAHTCTFTSYFDLLTSLAPDLLAAYNASLAEGGSGVPREGIPVQAGQLIGRIGAQTLDFGVYDYNVTLPGFLVPAHYSEDWKIHTVDPFPYFPPDVRDRLLAKMLRQAEPRAGKIDYDVDGRLVGNWFKAGTGGYGFGANYWEGHLSIAPDGLVPSRIDFSIGNWSGQPMQWAIRGNALDPANVSVATGLVKFEVVRGEVYDTRTNSSGGLMAVTVGDPLDYRELGGVEGAVLVQMLEDRLLKLETFPGKTAAEVSGFTDAARVYER